MKKLLFLLLAAVSAALFAWAIYLVASGPPEPAFNAPDRNAVIAHLNHLYTEAAYAIVWAIQLGYVAWLGTKWQADKTPEAQGR